MLRSIVFCLFIFMSGLGLSQFSFYGEVSDDFKHSKAYLILVDDYKKSDLLLVEDIISECHIDSGRTFKFSGNFLKQKNQYFKIYIDKCNNNINDSKHLLNKCDSYISKLFIANNSDTLFFPLNELNQMLCEIDAESNDVKHSLSKIDSLEEDLLSGLMTTLNDNQREMIYKNYFVQLKNFSQKLGEPLAELYAFSRYSAENSFSRNYYLEDLKKSNYYKTLLDKMNRTYSNSSYTLQLKNELEKDNYSKLSGITIYQILTFVFGGMLFLALLVILKFVILKPKKEKQVDYKTVLTNQELKVFDLMKRKLSNKEIADSLFVSVSTIKTHINNIYTKLSISSRKEIESYS